MVMEIDLGPSAEKFRDELRQWLEANRPEDLDPDAGERGAAAAPDRARGVGPPAGLDRQAGRGRLHVRELARGVRRPRPDRPRGGGHERGVRPGRGAAGDPGHGRVAGRARRSSCTAPTSRRRSSCPASSAARTATARASPSPTPGSDLAGLKTRGVVDGEEIVITGQKVWTSGAQMANMMFCLCRTDPEAPKHQGISYVLVPMKTADGESNGIELRPLRQLTGNSGFTETFLTEARAPLFNVIGGLNNGWRVTMTTLGNERGGNATTQHVRFQRQFWRLVDEARRLGRNDDPVVRQELARAYTKTEIMRYAGLRTLSEVVARKEPGPGASINKMFWSEYARDIGEWTMNLRGAHAMIRPDGDGYPLDRWQAEFLGSRSGTIWGGTAQVQRNIVGERVLGLPKEPGHNEEDR